jgi:predicted amidohydrolase
MNLTIGVAQIPNSPDIEKNFISIFNMLEGFQSSGVDVILFPECSLSGFSSKMKDSTRLVLYPFLNKIQTWTNRTGIEVVLPTAIVDDAKIYNSGFWFKQGESYPFYKIGLTKSESGFFSLPIAKTKKVFEIKGFNLAVLICYEAEHEPWRYFQAGDADAILWPGYWGWTLESEWQETRVASTPNPIFANIKTWNMPLIQANFALNDLEGHTGSGPEGLSFVISSDNKLLYRGAHLKHDRFLVRLSKTNGKTTVSDCLSIS